MNIVTVADYLRIEQEIAEKIELLKDEAIVAYEAASLLPVPVNLRPATKHDIVEGAVLWYPHWEERKWAIIEEVRYPDDQWKAFVFQGARYGLYRAFVEITD